MTNDPNRTLERIAQRVAVPEPAYDRLFRRRDRRERSRRITTAVVVVVLALLSITGLVRAFHGQHARPASEPTPTPVEHGIFSGKGGWIAYSDTGGIWAMDPERRGTKVLLTAAGGVPLAWSSDGSRLLLQTGRGHALLVLHDNGSETPLLDPAYGYTVSGGSFSPDGSTVVFACGRLNGGDSGVYVVDAGGGTPKRLFKARSMLMQPTFSPDGSQIAYFEGGSDSNNTLRVMNADGSGFHVLLRDTGVMKRPSGLQNLAWFPDGTRLVFDMGYGPYSIYTVRADGSGLTRLIRGSDPYLSPDGSRIAYGQGAAYGEGPLAIADADGTHVHRFVHAEPGPWNPLPRAKVQR